MKDRKLNKDLKILIEKINSFDLSDLNKIYPELIKLSLKINFPVYSLNTIIKAKERKKTKTSEDLYNGWTDEKNYTMNNQNNTGQEKSKQSNNNNNTKLILIIVILVALIAIIGIVFFWPKGTNEGQMNEETAWTEAIKRNTARAYNLYLQSFPQGKHIFEVDSAIYALNNTRPDNTKGGGSGGKNQVTIKLDKNRIVNLAKGSSKEIRVNISPKDENFKVSCNSNSISYKTNKKKKNIIVTGVQAGKATLKVYSSTNPNSFKNCTITVVPDSQTTSVPSDVIKVSTIKFINPPPVLNVGESLTFKFEMQPESSNSIRTINLKIGNSNLIDSPTSIYPNATEVKLTGLKEGNTQIWLEVEQKDGSNVISDRQNISVESKEININDIIIQNRGRFSQIFHIGDLLPELQISYLPEYTTQKGVTYEISNPNLLKYNSYTNQYEAISQGVTYIKVISKENSKVYDQVKITILEKTRRENPDNKIYDIAETPPAFKGGQSEMGKYLRKNIKYPVQAKENGTQGIIYISFVVEKDGSLTDIKILRGIGDGCDEEAVRVIKNMPKWVPGKNKNKVVRIRYSMPIKFSLQSL